MGICIEAAATSLPHGRLFGRGALHLSDAAARDCLERGHHRPTELDLIVNVGLYKDHGLAEPALASLIQEDIGANPGHPPRRGAHGTFSFDLLAGSNGVVTAAYVLDGFVASATAKLALIVAGDSPPSPVVRVPFEPAAGAILLAHSPDDVGFTRFVFETFAEDAGMFEVRTRWDPHAGVLRRGGNVLEIYEAPAFRARCIEHGIAVARRLLDEARLSPTEVDLLVGNQLPAGFAGELADGLGLPPDRVPHVATELAHAYTAGPIAALEEGLRRRPRTVLFVTAGAGITIGAALYLDRRAG
jgi:3-oxoacyl-[acyl-carrier-protein] synthase III